MPSLALAPSRRLDADELVDALGAWRRDDIDDLELDPGDLLLLTRLRAGDDEEPPDR